MSAVARRIAFVNNLSKLYFQNANKAVGIGSIRFIHLTDVQNGLRSKWRGPTLREMKHRVKQLKDKGTYPLNIRSQYIEWNYDSELFAFGKRFNENFEDGLLREAFTDPSYIFKETQRLQSLGLDASKLDVKSNKDLADAGSALIINFTTKYIRAVCSLLPEEGVMSFVDHLSSDEVLCKTAKELGFRDLILTKDYPPSTKTFANSFCAVVACLNVSSGLERCDRFILDFVLTQLVGKDMFDFWELDNPEKVLWDIMLRSGRGQPEPRLMGDLGKNTVEAVFHVGFYDNNKELIGIGFGQNVDEARMVAAYDSLSRLFDQSVSRSPMPFINLDPSSLPSKTEPNPSINEWTMKSTQEAIA